MIVPTECADWRHLDELYAGAKAELSKLLMELSALADSPENAGFERAWAACAAQRSLCSQIREQIHSHMREHGCGQSDKTG